MFRAYHGAMSEDAADAFRQWQKQGSRRRLMMFVGATLLAVAGGLVLAFLRRPGAAGVDAQKLAEIRDFLPQIHGDSRRAFAASALAELEVGRLPQPILGALADAGNGAPELLQLTFAKALADPALAPVWKAECPQGPGALGTIAMSEPMAQGQKFCDACATACEKLGPGAHGKLGETALAALAAAHLARHADPDPTELELLRIVASPQ